MAEFINTIDALGDEVVIDSIIDRTITEFKDDSIETIGAYAFYGCATLENVELPNAVFAATKGMFTGNVALKNISIPRCTKLNTDAFNGLTSLNTIELDACTAIGYSAFKGCSQLKKLVLPNCIRVENGGFQNCGLEYIDLKVATYLGATYLFGWSYDVKTLILRSETICASAGDPFAVSSSTNVHIYVPKALLSDDDETKDYRRATNWSTYADKFRALEDYTVDGTTTGELDETKI